MRMCRCPLQDRHRRSRGVRRYSRSVAGRRQIDQVGRATLAPVRGRRAAPAIARSPPACRSNRSRWARADRRARCMRLRAVRILKRSSFSRAVDLRPLERHRHGRARQRTHAERRHEQPAVAVLQIVDVDLAAAIADGAHDRRDVGQRLGGEPRDQLGERARLLVRERAPSGISTCRPVEPLVFA